MAQEALTLYKLIVLYMIDTVNFPLTKSQIGDFLLGKEYTHFLTLQQVWAELEEAGMILTRAKGNRTHISITDEGKSTLRFFENRISDEIKNDIQNYMKEHKWDIIEEVSITSEYYKTTNNEYIAQLIAKEKGIDLVDIKLTVPLESMAASICDNWQNKNQEIYKYLTEQLF